MSDEIDPSYCYIKCECGKESLQSKYRHDFHYCSCGTTFVDGGKDYLRYGSKELDNVEVITPEEA